MVGNSTSPIVDFANLIATSGIELAKQHGMIITVLAFIGAFSIFTAIVNEAFRAIRYLFTIFIAAPLVLAFGLINRNLRKQRLKELGEIRAHIKQHPDRAVRIMFFVILCIFVVVLMFLGVYFLNKFLLPLGQFNEITKTALQNSSINLTK